MGFMHLFNQISKEPPKKEETPTTPMLLLKKKTDASKTIRQAQKELTSEEIEIDEESFED